MKSTLNKQILPTFETIINLSIQLQEIKFVDIYLLIEEHVPLIVLYLCTDRDDCYGYTTKQDKEHPENFKTRAQ